MGALVIVFSLIVSIVKCACAGRHDIYSNFTVYGVQIQNRDDQSALHKLEYKFELDVWQHGAPGVRDALVMVPPQYKMKFLDELDAYGMIHYLDVNDVARTLEENDEQWFHWRQTRSSRAAVPFEDYPRVSEVYDYLERVANQHPDIVTLVTAGQSYEGRDIKYLKISTTNFQDPSKPIYFLDAMIHAREWVTTPVALYTIHRLVEDLRDEDWDLLEQIDWIILPVVNPDGYEYTHTDERLWRRTRSYNPSVSVDCYGIDANRNFDVNFNTVGVSSDPCSNTYPGHEAFSEIETRHVRDIMFEHLDRIQLYLNIHSHGNYVLFAYGDTSLPENAAALHLVGAAMGAEIDAVKLPEAPFYLVGNSALVLYGTSGNAQDYAQYIGIPFSYTLELPGYGFAFQVPPEYISQINEETWRGVAVTARLSNIYYRANYATRIHRND